MPSLASSDRDASDPLPVIPIRVGDLVGWAGAAEIRSAFAGTLEGILVLPGERVVAGQPVAWLRAASEDAPAGRRSSGDDNAASRPSRDGGSPTMGAH